MYGMVANGSNCIVTFVCLLYCIREPSCLIYLYVERRDEGWCEKRGGLLYSFHLIMSASCECQVFWPLLPPWETLHIPYSIRKLPHMKVLISVWWLLGKAVGEGNGTLLQYSCLGKPMDGGAWWAAAHGIAKSWTWLSDFPFTFHFHALEKEMATHSSVLAWRIPGMGEPDELLSLGSHRVGYEWCNLAAAAGAGKAVFITQS